MSLLLALALCLPGLPRSARAQDDDRGRAIELFQASQEAYRAGRFREAAVFLEEAYRLDPNPILLYNLARARESAGDLELAVEAYRRYLAEAPEAPDRASVEARVTAIRTQLDDRTRLEEMVEAERRAKERAAAEAEQARAVAEAQTTAPAPSSGPGVAPWVVAGVGVLGVGAGVALGLSANDQRQQAVDAPEQLRASQLADDADGLALGANIAYAAGGALIVGGVIWAWVGASSDEEPPATVLIGPSGLSVIGRF